MGSRAGCRWLSDTAVAATGALTICMAALAVAALSAAGPAMAASSDGEAHGSAPKTAQLDHAPFWECPAKTTETLVAVNTLTLDPGAPLVISFTVHNGGTTACRYTAPYADVEPGSTSTSLVAGPCGSVDFEIIGSQHRAVWPGPEVINCPALGFAQLAPNGTVTGTGSWHQTRPNGTRRVPAGNYTLLVDGGHFSFPLRVTGS
jgi:hypothetical protein